MNQMLLLLAFAWPLLLAAVWPIRACRGLVGRLAPWAPLPAMVLVVAVDEFSLDLPWLLLGSRFGIDTTGRVFLGLTGALWLASGLFARSYLRHDAARERYDVFHLLTMAGNLGAIVSQDMVSFMALFTLMSFAAYCLIVHERTAANLWAGRVYIVLVVLGEMLLFWAIVLAVGEAGTLFFDELRPGLAQSPQRGVIAGLVLAGFGIKLGVMPLHVWLPLAHPAAPTPASAVLSGAIIKTGLLGMIRFLPLGAVAMPEWGAVCVVAGTATAFLAVFVGLTQSHPKTVLAYSSVSQMGLAAIGVGAALMAPQAWPTVLAALLLFAVHHGISKAALFLGTGIALPQTALAWQRRLFFVAMLIPALALAGLPLTSGLPAKAAIKYAGAAAPGVWAGALEWLLPITSATTALLMARFLIVRTRHEPRHASTSVMLVSFGALAVGPAALFFAIRWREAVDPAWVLIDLHTLQTATWPLIVAGALTLTLLRATPLSERLARLRIPPGDVIVPLTVFAARLYLVWNRVVVACLTQGWLGWERGLQVLTRQAGPRLVARAGRAVESELTAGVFVAVIVLIMLVLLWA